MRRGWITLVFALLAVVLLMYGCADKFVTSGKIAMNSKNWDKALSDFTKALQTNPGNAQAHFFLAKVYAVKQNYALMSQHLTTADSLDPKLSGEISKLRDSTWYLLAGTADSAMNEVPKIEKDSRTYFDAALGQVSANQADSATKNFDRAKVNLRIRDNAKADSVYTQAVAKAKASQIEAANVDFDSALSAATYGIYVDAKNKFETAMLIAPKKPEAFAKTGFAWFRLGSDDSSFYYYKRAYDLAPDNMEILGNLVRMAGVLGKSSIVDSLCAKILEKDPKNLEALIRRGEIADNDSQYEKAVGFYKSALEIKTDQCNIWFALGVIYFQKLQKVEDAEQAFTQAANLCPDDPNAVINLSVILITNNKLDDAISRLTTYTDNNPKDCTGWDLLSQALLRKGLKDKALEADKKYKECKDSQ